MDIPLAWQLASFVGALIILVAGAGQLAQIAFHPFPIGFLVEVTWILNQPIRTAAAVEQKLKMDDCRLSIRTQEQRLFQLAINHQQSKTFSEIRV